MKIYRIWQLPHHNPRLFHDYNEEKFDFKDYCCVWWDNWDDEIPTDEQLEIIFHKFNCELPNITRVIPFVPAMWLRCAIPKTENRNSTIATVLVGNW